MDLALSRPAWYDAAHRFNEAFGHCGNYPLAYVYAIFLGLSGHILGRRCFAEYGLPLYPNHYLCLVGPSALSRKSTALSVGLQSLGEDRVDMHPMRTLTTRSGLLLSMSQNDGRGLVVLDELASITLKRQDFASDLITTLVELYANPDSTDTYTRHNPIHVDNAFLTILSGSTIEWLRAGLTNATMLAGFGNRMTFVVGDPRPPKAWPNPPNLDSFGWQPLWRYKGKALRLSEDARPLWDKFYYSFEAQQATLPPLIRTLRERIPEKVIKAALVMAAWRGAKMIDDDLIGCAIDWGLYLQESLNSLTPSFEAEDKQVLAALHQGRDTRTKLFNTLSHTMSVKRVREAIGNLHWLGYIKEEDGHFVTLEDNPAP